MVGKTAALAARNGKGGRGKGQRGGGDRVGVTGQGVMKLKKKAEKFARARKGRAAEGGESVEEEEEDEEEESAEDGAWEEQEGDGSDVVSEAGEEGDEDQDEEDGDYDEDDGDSGDVELAVGTAAEEADEEAPRNKVKGPLTLKRVAKFKKKQDTSGVVYLSRVPPYMKPEKLRHLLGRYGKVGRVFLTPEDPAVRSKRKAMGGNKRQNYIDGWIEFEDKRDAKMVAKELNTRAIGGKSTSFYSADLWNLKYLSKFKWHHLTEKIAYDNTVRRHKLQAEIAQAKREKDFYLERVDQSKQIRKKAKKAGAQQGGGEEHGKEHGTGAGGVLRTFRQASGIDYLQQAGSVGKGVQGGGGKKPQGGAGAALLSKIFGK